ncbi:MAG: beta-alanine-activating enzyme beta-propeller domain-containing protein [Anaerolineae bacterium]
MCVGRFRGWKVEREMALNAKNPQKENPPEAESVETRKFPTRRVSTPSSKILGLGQTGTQALSKVPEGKEHPEGTLPPGMVLQNRYEIIEVIGVGGMGAVYKARDLRFPNVTRLCAVKEMISSTPDPHIRHLSIQNFEREASILATLSHPSIPKIFDYFSEGDRSYLVLEFVSGKDLETILEETESFLPERTVVEWAAQICEVLAYLHSHKPDPIVFRDMKPSNVMLNDHNLIVLVDFGIAKVFQVGQKGTMIGTEGYSPPEQYRGAAEPRGDLYALGATMHHLLTKRDPRQEPPFTFHERPPRSINPNISEKVEAVIMKALEYDIDKRFSSALEMKEALLKTLPSKSQVAVASLPTAVITQQEEIMPVWEFICEDEVRSSPRVAGGVLYIGVYDYNLYALDAKTGQFIWKYPTEGGICATPCVWEDKVFIGSEDNIFYAIYTRTGRIAWTCPTQEKIRSSAVVSYGHVFFGSDDGNLYALNAQTGRLAWQFQSGRAIRSSPAVLEKEETIYFGSNDRAVYALEIQTGKTKWRQSTNQVVNSSPAIHEEGLVVIGSSDWNVYAFNARSGWMVWRYRTGQAVVSSPAIAEDRVYVGSVDGNLYALNLKTGRVVWKYATEGQVTSSPAVAGGAVYFGSVDGYLYCLDAKTGELRWRFKTGGPVPSSPTVADGLVFIGSTDGRVYALPM